MMRPTFHGLLVLDKPGGITSRDAVDRALRWFPRGTRVGHTGTLDPLATGVLVLCVGAATRLSEYVQRVEKTYRTRLQLGARSDTDDADGVIEPVVGATAPDPATVTDRIQEFLGEIEQVPPAFSAVKVAGHRAYDLARKGREVTLEPRRVHIHAINTLAYQYPYLDLEVRCGKGTYIRSLARDLGERLGCGAFVETLRRTRVGSFDARNGLNLEADEETARAGLLPLSAAVRDLPRLVLRAADIGRLQQGQSVAIAEPAWPDAPTGDSSAVAVFTADGSLAVVGVLDPDQRRLRPRTVFPY